MKKYLKFLIFPLLISSLSSCGEIDDKMLERSNPTIYDQLEADRNQIKNDKDGSDRVSFSGGNYIKGDKYFDSTCQLTVTKSCTLAESYACMVLPEGETTGFKTYASQEHLTVKEALYYLSSKNVEYVTDYYIAQCGCDNEYKYLYILPCKGQKYGEIRMELVSRKSTEGFDGTVRIGSIGYSDSYTIANFYPTEYDYLYGFFTLPDQSYRNDASLALLLDIDNTKMLASEEETKVYCSNPNRESGVVVTRAIDRYGKLSNKISRSAFY